MRRKSVKRRRLCRLFQRPSVDINSSLSSVLDVPNATAKRKPLPSDDDPSTSTTFPKTNSSKKPQNFTTTSLKSKMNGKTLYETYISHLKKIIRIHIIISKFFWNFLFNIFRCAFEQKQDRAKYYVTVNRARVNMVMSRLSKRKK